MIWFPVVHEISKALIDLKEKKQKIFLKVKAVRFLNRLLLIVICEIKRLNIGYLNTIIDWLLDRLID